MIPATNVTIRGLPAALCAVLLACLAGAPGAAAYRVVPVEPGVAPPAAAPAKPPLPSGSGRGGARASSAPVADAAAEGVRANGKIVGSDPHAGAYSCSGTAINTASKSIVLTAGHCVRQNRSNARRLTFIPAYGHHVRPYGSFTVEVAYVMGQWLASENPDFDLAALRVRPNKLGALTDVVGARGYATNRSRYSRFRIFGYPAAALRGEEMRSCPAHGLGSDPLTFPFPGPPTVPSSCDMAAGSSGGGWLLGGSLVNGVTSYGYPGRPTRLHSPYFGHEVAAFLRRLP